jgi:hypothetical protein
MPLGQRLVILLGTANWVAQAARNLVMDLEDAASPPSNI